MQYRPFRLLNTLLNTLLNILLNILLSLLLISSLGVFSASRVAAHGSVTLGEDVCLININFMQAHFTVFQPESRGNEEYCEEVPDVTRAVFVMEYLHALLPEMEIDFRIVEDTNDLGRYADWEAVQQIADLDAVTVHYDPPRIETGGYYRSSYEFVSPGNYLGIVTTQHPTEPRNYQAVFYFRVGGADWGSFPLFILILVVLQITYWLSTGGWTKLRTRRQK